MMQNRSVEGVARVQKFDVQFYDKPDGEKPAKEFIIGLPSKMKAKTLWAVNMLAVNGTELREPYSKHLVDGIFELRMQLGSDISRILFFFMVGQKAILTHGFIKKTQKLRLQRLYWQRSTALNIWIERSVKYERMERVFRRRTQRPGSTC